MTKIISSTLYRQYRPTDFAEVLGQKEVVTVLENAISTKKIGHAYLFAGGRGSGKTTLARIFAKNIGTSKDDVYEIDAASNRKIDEIRSIRDMVDILPISSQHKVYIIDEVHMLTPEAFNALLKTLEEPPQHVIFILATTEKHKMPDTIVSRCQVFDFKKATLLDSASLVGRVADQEKVDIDQEAKDFIATLGNGSFRDTLTYLQKAIAFLGDKINFIDIKKVFENNQDDLENELLEHLNNKDKDAVWSTYKKLLEHDVDFDFFLQSLLLKMRAILLMRNSNQFKEFYAEKFSQEKITFLSNLKNINSILLKDFLGLLEEAKYLNNKNVLFEIFLTDHLR